MNKVMLIGRTTNDVELNITSNGNSYVRGTLAVSRRGVAEVTDYVPFVAWNQNAQFLKRYAPKGTQILIEGSIKVDSYIEKATQQRRRSFDVNVDNITILESRKSIQDRIENRSFGENVIDSKTTYEKNFNNSNNIPGNIQFSKSKTSYDLEKNETNSNHDFSSLTEEPDLDKDYDIYD
ncbi:single-stranded DNA-binding protein [Mycoplasmopsis felis]|uniref:single-stranded DNA-binding protein n=1 Tax=Mycoplasmopsis felis TaxID=33923 RepID=UPI002AFEDBD9|nr:single-stranded DNA-binding protein [Mycoplasmopsis felis]WQQ11139.1 single-stranded DNA-binding protein [Mycoplasmopsis felis]